METKPIPLAVAIAIVLLTASVPASEIRHQDESPSSNTVVDGEWTPVEEFEGLEDPDSWRVDTESEVQYRRATSGERANNDWPLGSYLVEFPTRDQAANGVNSLSLTIPFNDSKTYDFDLDLEAYHDGPDGTVFHLGDNPPGGTNHAVDFGYYQYRSTVSDERGSYLIVSSQDGISGKAMMGDRVASIKGSEEHWELEDLPTPTNHVPSQED